jgi:hypothetical protein
MARCMLGWTRHELAQRAVLSDATLNALENTRGTPANVDALAAVQATLEAAGIEFLVYDDAPRLRLRKK